MRPRRGRDFGAKDPVRLKCLSDNNVTYGQTNRKADKSFLAYSKVTRKNELTTFHVEIYFFESFICLLFRIVTIVVNEHRKLFATTRPICHYDKWNELPILGFLGSDAPRLPVIREALSGQRLILKYRRHTQHTLNTLVRITLEEI